MNNLPEIKISDINSVICLLLVTNFPDNEPEKILDIIEKFEQPRGLDEPSEFEQEVWQKYNQLRAKYKMKDIYDPEGNITAEARILIKQVNQAVETFKLTITGIILIATYDNQYNPKQVEALMRESIISLLANYQPYLRTTINNEPIEEDDLPF